MNHKKTLVLGASLKPHRYSYKAVIKLLRHDIPVVAMGMREGSIGEVKIEKSFPEFPDIHTVSMYIGTKHQSPYFDNILKLNPERVIFNPGTVNPEFEDILRSRGIEVLEECMLVKLSNGSY